MQIVILDGYTANPGDLSWSGLAAFGELTVYDRTEAGQVAGRIGGAEVVYTNKTVITRQTMEACPNLKYIGVLATGYNIVDTQAARELGVTVTNVPSYATEATCQHTIALLLELCHHAGAHSDSVLRGDWAACQDFAYWNSPLILLAGKTLGVIGFGRIGQKVAAVAQALGMKVLAYSRTPRPELESNGCRLAGLDEVLANADVITLHCPLFPETQGLICKDTIEKMKDGVLLVNTSRGPVLVEADVRDALNSGKIAGAAVDVVSREPISGDNPLLQAKNIIITPHIAWAPKEARQVLLDVTAANLKAFVDGSPVNVVN